MGALQQLVGGVGAGHVMGLGGLGGIEMGAMGGGEIVRSLTGLG